MIYIKKLFKIAGLLSIFLVIVLIIITICSNNIKYHLNGDDNVVLDVGSLYKDEGVTAKVFKWNLVNKVSVNNKLDTNIIGNYKLEYKLKFLGFTFILNRNIKVVDNVPPSIELKGKTDITLFIGEKYNDDGAIAFDNYDKDISNLIEVESNLDIEKEGKYNIIYSVKDSSGNKSSVSRNITVSTKNKPANNKVNNNEIIDLNDPIIKYITEKNYKVSIGYYNLVTKEEYLYKENKLYYGASLIKTLDAIYLYDNNLVTDTIRPHIEKAISVSDDKSHSYLINHIGRANLKKYGTSLGAKYTLYGQDNYGYTTVNDQIIYLKKLYSMIKENSELKSFFINDYRNYLKIDNIDVMHKYGYYEQYYHDVGIVLDDTPYIVVILTNHGNKNEKEVINNLSDLIYKYHKKELE